MNLLSHCMAFLLQAITGIGLDILFLEINYIKKTGNVL
jgi:hypothetical protein